MKLRRGKEKTWPWARMVYIQVIVGRHLCKGRELVAGFRPLLKSCSFHYMLAAVGTRASKADAIASPPATIPSFVLRCCLLRLLFTATSPLQLFQFIFFSSTLFQSSTDFYSAKSSCSVTFFSIPSFPRLSIIPHKHDSCLIPSGSPSRPIRIQARKEETNDDSCQAELPSVPPPT